MLTFWRIHSKAENALMVVNLKLHSFLSDESRYHELPDTKMTNSAAYLCSLVSKAKVVLRASALPDSERTII